MSWTDILRKAGPSNLSGKKWTVFHMKTDGTIPSREMHDLGWDMSGEVTLSKNQFDKYYEKMATIELKNPSNAGSMLYRLTNNVSESWSRDFEGEHDEWNMELHKPVGDMGHRSSMPGDVYLDIMSNKYYMIAPAGWNVLTLTDGE